MSENGSYQNKILNLKMVQELLQNVYINEVKFKKVYYNTGTAELNLYNHPYHENNVFTQLSKATYSF